ncbi:MAG TPA: hypothetical protein VES88_05480 [Gemmatimonadaceae bacterium]|nr:hypothetical protein [Gemmatimonadaceae bacterium]
MLEILVLAAAWLLLSLVFCGVGALVRRAFRSRVVDESDVFFDWWIGWGLVIIFLLGWHLAMPVNAWAFVPITIVGLAGASVALKDWKRAVQPSLRNPVALSSLVALAWLTVAAMAVGPDRQYDTGLYHLQSVRWAQAYPVVPGLANVDGRFGTNSSFFLFAALTDAVRIHGTTLRLAAGLMFLPVIVQGILRVHAAVTGRQKMGPVGWFQTMMVPVTLWQARQYASSMSPDGVVFLLTVVVSAELLRLLGTERRASDENLSESDWDYRVFEIILLMAIAVTVKVSLAIFAVGAVALALWNWWTPRAASSPSVAHGSSARGRRLARMILPAILAGVLWIAHGVMLSGYIAYPSAIGYLPVDWRTPASIIRSDADWIFAWARSPGMDPREVLANQDWVQRWLAATARDRDVVGAAFALALGVALAFANRRRRRRLTNPAAARAYIFLLPSVLFLAFWLFTAPAVRFAIGPLWVVAIGVLALSVAASGDERLNEVRLRKLVPAGLGVMLATACAVALSEPVRRPSRRLVKPITTLSGLSVYLPVSGDRCGDAPLPCSSKPPDERLELRDRGTLAKGFRIAR